MAGTYEFKNVELIGGYNPKKRRDEVLEKLDKLLENLEKEIEKIIENILANEPKKDICTRYLEAKVEEIDEVETEITNFKNEGNHFTKEYRTLQGHCGKLQTDLDAIDVTGRDELRQERKKALVKIENMAQVLAEKAHSSGRICPQCQVKE